MLKPRTLTPADPLNMRGFLITIRRLADSLNYGADRSPYVGAGNEYLQSRPYQPGDAVKAIDWRVTARMKRYFVKEYEAPKRMPVYLLVDTSASMMVSSTAVSKYARAVQIAGGLALACLDRFSPVAILGVGERRLCYPPSLSRDRALQWLHELRMYRLDETTALARKLIELEPMLSQRSLLVVLSDLNEPLALRPLKRISQHHECVVLQLRDPAEITLCGGGFLQAREAESGAEFVTRGKRLGVDHDLWQQTLRGGRVDQLVIRTDEPFSDRLRHFFRTRDRLGRGAR